MYIIQQKLNKRQNKECRIFAHAEVHIIHEYIKTRYVQGFNLYMNHFLQHKTNKFFFYRYI